MNRSSKKIAKDISGNIKKIMGNKTVRKVVSYIPYLEVLKLG